MTGRYPSAVNMDILIGVIAVAVAVALPFLDMSRYILTQITLFFIWAGIITQWNLVFGTAGIFSLAQMAVFAMGGYTTAMLGLYLDWSLWAAAPVGAITAVLFSIIIGAATLRLRGPYVALLTLAVAEAMREMIVTDVNCFYYVNDICYNFTGGSRSLSKFGDFGFREWLGYKNAVMGDYYLGLFLLVLGMVFAFVIIRSPLGCAFRAIRDNPDCAVTQGINRVKYQLLVFALSAFFTGLMGGFYAGHFRTMGPSVLDLSVLLFLLSMLIVGGLGHAWGPLLGCGLLMLADEMLRDFGEWRMIGVGTITVAFIVLVPGGIAGLIHTIFTTRRGLGRYSATSPVTVSMGGENPIAMSVKDRSSNMAQPRE